MAVKATEKPENKHESHELLESPEALADQLSKTEEFVSKNKSAFFGIIGILVLAVGGFFGYKYYASKQDTQAQADMFQAIFYFEADSLQLGLNGDGNNLGFLDIIDEYGSTDAGNLANFYAGVSYLKLGEFEKSIAYLESFSSSDLLVQARAYSLRGDAFMELKDYASAAELYTKAADYNANKFFSPTYLMKAGIAYENASDTAKAIAAYDKIIKKYWDAAETSKAKKYKARLEASAS